MDVVVEERINSKNEAQWSAQNYAAFGWFIRTFAANLVHQFEGRMMDLL